MNSLLTSWTGLREVSTAFTYLDRVESTNTWLMQKSTVDAGEVVLTMDQFDGRGRFRRTWINNPGEGLAFSVVLPRLARSEALSQASTWIPLLVGVAVVRSLRAIGVSDATMKWPNDVLVGRQKLAGILCEVREDGFVVAGVGINFRFSGTSPDPRAISLDELVSRSPSRLDGLVADIVRRCLSVLEGDTATSRDAVMSVLGTLGQDIQVIGLDGSAQFGRALGLDYSGALIVKMRDGSRHVVLASHIEHLYQ